MTGRRWVSGHRSQKDVEPEFRPLKDAYVVGFYPMCHWTESKIRVRVFHCAPTLAHLMRRQAHHGDLDLSAASYWPPSPGSKRPSCSTPPGTTAGPGPNASSPTPTPPRSASTTSSDSTPMLGGVDLSNTPSSPKNQG